MLTTHFEHKIFVTATSQNGYAESFSALLELIDNQRFARGVPPDRDQLQTIMVRRLKTELVNWDGTSGGKDNKASAPFSTVGGGSNNSALASYATIGGGGPSDPAAPYTGNTVSDDYGTVSGGGNNPAGNNDGTTNNATYATVGGGHSNIASSHYSSIGGGQTNIASGPWSTVPGGLHNAAIGKQSFAAGTMAYANGVGSFAWADSNAYALHAWNQNEFVCRATGGFFFITKVDNTGYPIEGIRIPAGKSTWIPIGSTTSAISQVQDEQIQKLEEENIALKKRVDELESRLTALEKILYEMDQKR